MKEARKVFDSMESRGHAPDVVSYSTLINGYCKGRMIDEAMWLFREMCSKGLMPDTITYSTLINGLFQNGRFIAAQELFNEMQACGQSPDIFTYNIMLDGLCKNQCLAEAMALLHVIKDRKLEPSIITYGILIDGMCKTGKLKSAMELFCSLPAKGFQPNANLYSIIINGLCKEGLLDEANELLVKMEENGCSPNDVTFNTIPHSAISKTPSRGRSDSVYFGTPTPVVFASADELIGEQVDVPRSGDSISVTIRFRPLRASLRFQAVETLDFVVCDCSEREFHRGDEIAWYADGDKIVRNEYNPATAYAFDRVFEPSTNSKAVYDVTARPVVKAAMEGVNASVAASSFRASHFAPPKGLFSSPLTLLSISSLHVDAAIFHSHSSIRTQFENSVKNQCKSGFTKLEDALGLFNRAVEMRPLP
ncbi:hypothetical protein HHK36_012797 [Tetracentron sinense]|uniref:Pentatricopeptide repeat-containing protein n=1 Tax=Tetracentron sinense TaxID=13715 RepID=A0A834Z9C5_TETSI|nr:hypothetical protein HHK36_012797 [Tetracentron sinense]